MNQRYASKPLKILLENLFLHSIGQLNNERYRQLNALEEKLQQTFQREGSWISILKAELDLPSNFEEIVQALWEKNIQIARARGETLDPVIFAQAFVDQNFDLDAS